MRLSARKVLLRWLFLLALVMGCSEPAYTGNPVKSIDLAELERLLGAGTFNGLVIAITSWCPPCKEELPVLARLFSHYSQRGIQMIAISLDGDGPSAVQPIIDRFKIPFPVYWVGQAAMVSYRIAGVPTTLFYKNGRLIEKIPGPMDRKQIEARLDALIAG